MTRRALPLAAAWLLAALALPAAADDRAAEAKKQKEAAEANLKKAGVPKAAAVETDDLLVFAAVPEAKAKPLAETLQKTYRFARTALKFADDEKLWPGKLTVYVLPEPAQFTNLVRAVEQRRPEKGETYTINVRGDQPSAVHSVAPGERATDAELTADAAAVVAAALLTKKAGAGAVLPEWLQLGFGRAAAVRADGNASRLAAYRTKTRAAVVGTKARPSPVRLADVWGGQKLKDGELVAASFVEFLAFGPEAEKFPRFVGSFKPSDERPMPNVELALADLEWKPDALELAWKQWVFKQK